MSSRLLKPLHQTMNRLVTLIGPEIIKQTDGYILWQCSRRTNEFIKRDVGPDSWVMGRVPQGLFKNHTISTTNVCMWVMIVFALVELQF